jgi:hypothetical protein
MTNQDPQTILTVYKNKKSRRIPGWSFDDLALLKSIKSNATHLWHHPPDLKIISLEEWKREL